MMFRKNMVKIANEVINGERAGNKDAAIIAINHAIWIDTRDLILDTVTTDEQLNAEIVEAVKAQLGK